MNIQEILGMLDGVKPRGDGGFMARCPCHDDKNGSLSISERDGKVLLHCFAGCSYPDIVAALNNNDVQQPNNQNEDIYDYQDADGKSVYEVVRFPGKKFRQRRSDGNGGHVWNLKGVEPTIYRLPRVIQAVKENVPVYIVEGERDVETLERIGLTATCNSGGAGKWRDSFSKYIKGANAVVIPDDDKPGHEHAEKVAASLLGVAASIKIVTLPNPTIKKGFDVSDWLADGGTRAEFEKLVAATPEYRAAEVNQTTGGTRKKFNPSPYVKTILNKFHIRYKTGAGFYVWDTGRRLWLNLPDDNLKQICHEILGVDESTTRQRSEVFEALKLQRAVLLQPEEDMNPDRSLLDVKNGMLDPVEMKLYPHDLKHLSTVRLPVAYDPGAECPLWEKTLAEWQPDPADRATLQEIAGYILAPGFNLEKGFIFVGVGANGKSVFVNTITAIIGVENVAHVSPADFEKDFHLVQLYNKTLNVVSDVSDRELLLTGTLKSVISCETVTDSFKHRDRFSFRPVAKHIFSMNSYPRSADRSDGFFRRWIVIDWPRTFAEDEQDHRLAEKLLSERDGIFSWALGGLQRLRENARFTVSDSAAGNIDTFRRVNDPIRVFCDYMIEATDPNAETESGLLYASYKNWSADNGFRTMSSEHFFRELRRVIPTIGQVRRRVGGNRKYILTGAKLLPHVIDTGGRNADGRSGWSG